MNGIESGWQQMSNSLHSCCGPPEWKHNVSDKVADKWKRKLVVSDKRASVRKQKVGISDKGTSEWKHKVCNKVAGQRVKAS